MRCEARCLHPRREPCGDLPLRAAELLLHRGAGARHLLPFLQREAPGLRGRVLLRPRGRLFRTPRVGPAAMGGGAPLLRGVRRFPGGASSSASSGSGSTASASTATPSASTASSSPRSPTGRRSRSSRRSASLDRSMPRRQLWRSKAPQLWRRAMPKFRMWAWWRSMHCATRETRNASPMDGWVVYVQGVGWRRGVPREI